MESMNGSEVGDYRVDIKVNLSEADSIEKLVKSNPIKCQQNP